MKRWGIWFSFGLLVLAATVACAGQTSKGQSTPAVAAGIPATLSQAADSIPTMSTQPAATFVPTITPASTGTVPALASITSGPTIPATSAAPQSVVTQPEELSATRPPFDLYAFLNSATFLFDIDQLNRLRPYIDEFEVKIAQNSGPETAQDCYPQGSVHTSHAGWQITFYSASYALRDPIAIDPITVFNPLPDAQRMPIWASTAGGGGINEFFTAPAPGGPSVGFQLTHISGLTDEFRENDKETRYIPQGLRLAEINTPTIVPYPGDAVTLHFQLYNRAQPDFYNPAAYMSNSAHAAMVLPQVLAALPQFDLPMRFVYEGDDWCRMPYERQSDILFNLLEENGFRVDKEAKKIIGQRGSFTYSESPMSKPGVEYGTQALVISPDRLSK